MIGSQFKSLKIESGGSLKGEILVPGDKSISHRALMLGGLAGGTSRILNLSTGQDVQCTLQAMRALGAKIDLLPHGDVSVMGGHLSAPIAPIDLGNAGTGIRLLAGVVAGGGIYSVLYGDSSLSRRPMDRVVEPLTRMGANILSRDGFAPLVNVPTKLNGIHHVATVASAQVKSAVLLAGLGAAGATTVTERVPSRRHTEEMLEQFGAKITISERAVRLEPGELIAADVSVPGDPSQAAFWAVGAAIAPESAVHIPNVQLSPERAGFVDVLRRMGANIQRDGNDLTVQYQGRLRSADIAEDQVSSLVDEVPILAIAAASAEGTSVFRGLHELTVKESNRLLGIARLLEALEVPHALTEDSISIEGVEQFKTATSAADGDHRMAMAAAIATLRCTSSSTLDGVEFVDTSYPMFFDELRRLRGQDSLG